MGKLQVAPAIVLAVCALFALPSRAAAQSAGYGPPLELPVLEEKIAEVPVDAEGEPAGSSVAVDLGDEVEDVEELEKDEMAPERAEVAFVSPLTPPALKAPQVELERKGLDWESAIRQSVLFLGVKHGFRMTEAKTRRYLPGPFFRDWLESVKNLGGWDDGGRFFTNYVAHPMQGAITGYVYVQNDSEARTLEFGRSKAYWKSRMKAMGWSAVWSTQFELGPISQASIGNVGLGANSKKMTYVDLVVTPTVGTGWIVAEDVLDKYVVRWVERRTSNGLVRALTRMALNPMRSCANALRFKVLWHRDTR